MWRKFACVTEPLGAFTVVLSRVLSVSHSVSPFGPFCEEHGCSFHVLFELSLSYSSSGGVWENFHPL